MNFHCYGNLWVHPFNFDNDRDNGKMKECDQLSEIYGFLHKSLKFPSNARVGNAKALIDYVANGEASDYMFAKHGIIAWSPELGNSDHKSDDFYIDRSVHEQVIRDDWATIEMFIYRHLLDLEWYDVKQVPQIQTVYNHSLNRKLAPQSAAQAGSIVLYWTFFNRG
jgi:hypothetical protein